MTERQNPALFPEALYAKSQIYIGRGLRANQAGNSDEYQLWASLALELLGKAALAKIHPALIADPTHYQSLFAACGRQLSPDLKTISAKTLFQRLGHVSKEFDTRTERFCEQMTLRRNAELHSGETPFAGTPPEAWERYFWHAAQVLLVAQEQSLESWVGAEDAKAPQDVLRDAERAIKGAVSARIERVREDFLKAIPNPKEREALIRQSQQIRLWEHRGKLDSSIDGLEPATCPSCGAGAVLGGVLWSEDVSEEVDPDDPTTEFIDETYLSEGFYCPTCALELRGRQEVVAADLPEEFYQQETREREFEPDYGND